MEQGKPEQQYKPAIGWEVAVFLEGFLGFFYLFASQMGLANTLNTIMNTAYDLLLNTVFYIMAVCVVMGAFSALFDEFGLVTLLNKLLEPLMYPVWGLPGAASLGIVTTFFSDNPAILALADNTYFRHFFKKYQFPALVNLGTAFGMGLIVCTFMLSQPAAKGESYGTAVAVGLLGAVVGSIVSGRLMLRFTKRAYGLEAEMISDGMQDNLSRQNDRTMRPVRSGSVGARLMDAVLTGGAGGVKMGLGIVPGVLTICTFVMMLTNGPGAEGYTGAAYEGIRLLPMAAERLNFLLQPLFGFSSPECVSVPITAMGAAGAAIGLVPGLLS